MLCYRHLHNASAIYYLVMMYLLVSAVMSLYCCFTMVSRTRFLKSCWPPFANR